MSSPQTRSPSYGDPHTLPLTKIPREVQTYIYSQAHELKFHLQLVSVRFNTASPTWGTHDVFCVNIVKDFPFLSEMRLSDLHMTTSGDDPENPHCPWTFIELRNTPHGTFYFLIQGVEPSALFTAPENVFRPCFSKENIIRALPPGEKVALVKATHITPYICSNCHVKPTPTLHQCHPCKEMKRNSFYYCSKACQRDHWKIHKTVCMKTRDPEAANITAAALNGVGIFASGLADPGV